MTPTERVLAAIDRTKQVMLAYWTACLAQRSAGSATAAGSVYELTPDEIEAALRVAEWTPYLHPSVTVGSYAYSAQVMGHAKLVSLSVCDPREPVTLLDSKGTGFVEACLKERSPNGTPWPLDATVLIVGPHEAGEVVFTFHPGPPVRPSRVPAKGNVGRVLTVSEAVRLGLTWGKVVSS